MNFKKHCMGYVAAALFAFADVSLAAPGAHGPNGEHLDGPATQVQGSSAPRLETRSESFEMVGRLSVSEFSMFINRDRKSTRLNSSHSQISYAVFCLKKKKNTTKLQ